MSKIAIYLKNTSLVVGANKVAHRPTILIPALLVIALLALAATYVLVPGFRKKIYSNSSIDNFLKMPMMRGLLVGLGIGLPTLGALTGLHLYGRKVKRLNDEGLKDPDTREKLKPAVKEPSAPSPASTTKPYCVKTVTGQTVKIECDPSLTVSQLKEKVIKGSNYLPTNVRLVHAGNALDDNRPLSDYNLTGNHVIQAFLCLAASPAGPGAVEEPSAPSPAGATKQYFVKTLTGIKLTLKCDPLKTIYQLKEAVAKELKCSATDFVLIQGKTLKDDQLLSTLKPETIHVVFRVV